MRSDRVERRRNRSADTLRAMMATKVDPPVEALSLSVERSGARATVMVGGEVDPATALHLRCAVRALRACGVTDYTIDCSELSYLDSSGINVLIELVEDTARVDGSVRVVEASSLVARVLAITGVDRLLHVEPAAPS